MWKTAWESIPTVVINATLIAAVFGAITNFIIALINNHRLRAIEKEKKMSEIQKYRYTNLFELVKQWNQYETENKGETAGQIAINRLINIPMDSIERYNIAKPLINPKHIDKLDEQAKKIHELLGKVVVLETEDGKKLDGFHEMLKLYSDYGFAFSDKLKKIIYDQLKELLLQDEQ